MRRFIICWGNPQFRLFFLFCVFAGLLLIFVAGYLVFGRRRDVDVPAASGPWPDMDLHMAVYLSGATVQERRIYASKIIEAYILRTARDSQQADKLRLMLRERVFTPDWILKGESDFMRQHIWQRSHVALCEQYAHVKATHDYAFCRNYVLEMVLREPLPCADIDTFISDWLTLKTGDVYGK